MIPFNDTSNLHRIHAVSFSATEASDAEFLIADNSGRDPRSYILGIIHSNLFLHPVDTLWRTDLIDFYYKCLSIGCQLGTKMAVTSHVFQFKETHCI